RQLQELRAQRCVRTGRAEGHEIARDTLGGRPPGSGRLRAHAAHRGLELSAKEQSDAGRRELGATNPMFETELTAPRVEPGGRLANRRAFGVSEMTTEKALHLGGRRARWSRDASAVVCHVEGG